MLKYRKFSSKRYFLVGPVFGNMSTWSNIKSLAEIFSHRLGQDIVNEEEKNSTQQSCAFTENGTGRFGKAHEPCSLNRGAMATPCKDPPASTKQTHSRRCTQSPVSPRKTGDSNLRRKACHMLQKACYRTQQKQAQQRRLKVACQSSVPNPRLLQLNVLHDVATYL